MAGQNGLVGMNGLANLSWKIISETPTSNVSDDLVNKSGTWLVNFVKVFS